MALENFRSAQRAYYPLAKKKLVPCTRTGEMVKRPEFIYHPVDPTKPEYIGTWVENPSGTQTVLTMTLDIDFHRSKRHWMLNEKNRMRLDYYRAMDWLHEEHPLLAQYLLHCCESTGHRGFSWEFAISPLELSDNDPTNETNRRSIWLFNMVRIYLVALLNHHGLGCDPSAIGLKRLTMNWRNPEFHVYTNKELHKNVWNRKRRTNVLRQLFDYLSELPEIKKGAWERWLDESWTLEDIYPDKRCRSKIAKLIVDLSDNGYCMSTNAKRLMVEYGLSKKVVYGVIRQNLFPEKMRIKVEANHGDWDISIDPSSDAIGLAYAELEKPKSSSKSFKLCAPEDVEDGNRYRWLGLAIVYLKYAGVDRASAYHFMLEIVERIPGYETSRNCQAGELLSKVRCIYKRPPKPEELNPQILPEFLMPKKSTEELSFSLLHSKSEKEIPLNHKKVYAGLGLSCPVRDNRDSLNIKLNTPILDSPVEKNSNIKILVEKDSLREDGGLPRDSEDGVVCKAVVNPRGELCSPQVVHSLVHSSTPNDRSAEDCEVCKDWEGGAGESVTRQKRQPSEAQNANTSHILSWGRIVLAAIEKRTTRASLRLGFSYILNRKLWPHPDSGLSKQGEVLLRRFEILGRSILNDPEDD